MFDSKALPIISQRAYHDVAETMKTAALVIGIDDYKGRPLTSAVNDAMAFRSALLEHALVPEADIRLLTSPVISKALAATSENLRDSLYTYYANGAGLDRFYFYFAGHGLLAYSNSANTRTRTALLPCDVEDLDKDGSLLLDFTELMDVLSVAIRNIVPCVYTPGNAKHSSACFSDLNVRPPEPKAGQKLTFHNRN